jgi:hypothetical protein
MNIKGDIQAETAGRRREKREGAGEVKKSKVPYIYVHMKIA